MRGEVRTYETAMESLRKMREEMRELGLSYDDAVRLSFDAYELGFDRANAIHSGRTED